MSGEYKVTVTVKSRTKELLVKAFQYVAGHVRDGNLFDYQCDGDTGGNEWSIKYEKPEDQELRHWKAVAETYQSQMMPKLRALEMENEQLKHNLRVLEASRKELKRLIDDVSLELESDDE